METSSKSSPEKESKRLRWQFIALGVGLLLIVGSALFMIFQPSGPEAPAITFTQEQTYSEAAVGEPLWVNPLLAVATPDRDLSALVFSGLTRLNSFGEPIPDLAESWSVSGDGLIYTFILRQDVTWHDGMPFTSADVDFTMRMLRQPDFSGPQSLSSFWTTIETYADDEYTVRFILTQPLAAFPEYAGIGILPAHLLNGIAPTSLPLDAFNLNPIGTGSLHWVGIEEKQNRRIVRLEPYTGFYDPARQIQLESLSLHYFSTPEAAFRSLGSVQGMAGLDTAQLDAILDSSGFEVYSSRQPTYGAIIFNQRADETLPFLQEEEVRRALTLALDRSAIINTVYPQQMIATASPILPGSWAYNPNADPLPYNMQQAVAELEAAGWILQGETRWREGVPLAFTLLTSDSDSDKELGLLIVSQWQKLGVDITLEAVTQGELVARVQGDPNESGRDFDAVLLELDQGGLADPDPYVFWHESQYEAGQNYGGAVDYDISQALEFARRDPNGVRRAELYQEFQSLFIERATAIILYNPIYRYTVSCQVDNVQLHILREPADRFLNIHEWTILSPSESEIRCSE